ncbi:integration host factor, actinobacterial type [Actinomyces oris]|uniref:integration host factor, actinobacterial type n=1 Tax=Actinomyces oris TaxID=544580 RepID=UPI0028E81368|nr:integration host factor, actinobacterial type [Actinomyces oris]
MTLPTLTPEQRAQALEKAAAARSQRARIKSELKSGELKLSEFFTASETDDVLSKMKVRALLVSLPRVGTTTADAILADVHIAESRRVRGLGANQRAALVERFG